MNLIERIHKGDDGKGKISIMRQWKNRNQKIKKSDRLFVIKQKQWKQIITAVKETEEEDVYFSINSFRHRKKVSEDVWHLNAFALDFDFYKTEKYGRSTASEFYYDALEEKLPQKPTAVVDSGRGLYVIYAFHHAPRACSELYASIYKSFYHCFKEYGLDPKALQITQYILVLGLANSKSGSRVKVQELNDTAYRLQDSTDILPYM